MNSLVVEIYVVIVEKLKYEKVSNNLDKEFKTVNKYIIENHFLRNILRKAIRKIQQNTFYLSNINSYSFRNLLRKNIK